MSLKFMCFCRITLFGCLAGVLACAPPAPVANQPSAATSVADASTADASTAEAKPITASEAQPPDAPRPLTGDELNDGWISLFDGETLYGWRPNSDANWRVEKKTIIVDSGTPGLLVTTAQFGDYVLKCDFRSARGTNSGIFLHTPFKATDPAKDCYELNIAPPDNPFPTASIVKRSKAEGNFESEDWQTFEATLDRANVKIAVNGKTVLEYVDPTPLLRGHIGLQLNQGKVEFRNIKLKPLHPESIFNGKDLTGWKEYPKMPSKFSVTKEGWLNVVDGRGQLESDKEYGDFVLQLECISNAQSLNSGVFFRSIPGEQMNGYECQIHNGIKNGDRTQPVDCGTGGIFRRHNARLVAANDLEWFHMTLIAERNHMAAWVNGYQVSDWTDDRKPDPNPRNGRRDEPGTLMLQGHDPTTNLSFRNIAIAEIAKRSE